MSNLKYILVSAPHGACLSIALKEVTPHKVTDSCFWRKTCMKIRYTHINIILHSQKSKKEKSGWEWWGSCALYIFANRQTTTIKHQCFFFFFCMAHRHFMNSESCVALSMKSGLLWASQLLQSPILTTSQAARQIPMWILGYHQQCSPNGKRGKTTLSRLRWLSGRKSPPSNVGSAFWL